MWTVKNTSLFTKLRFWHDFGEEMEGYQPVKKLQGVP
jgi:hypothetical protein